MKSPKNSPRCAAKKLFFRAQKRAQGPYLDHRGRGSSRLFQPVTPPHISPPLFIQSTLSLIQKGGKRKQGRDAERDDLMWRPLTHQPRTAFGIQVTHSELPHAVLEPVHPQALLSSRLACCPLPISGSWTPLKPEGHERAMFIIAFDLIYYVLCAISHAAFHVLPSSRCVHAVSRFSCSQSES